MNPKTIRVQGKGTVSQAPDRIRIAFTVSGNHLDFTQTVGDCNAGIEALRAAAKESGIDPSELKTTHFDVREDTEYLSGKHLFIGFRATHRLGIVLPINKVLLGRFLSAVCRGKAKPQVNLAFEVSDPEGLKQKVLASAVENAKCRATTIADASGIKLSAISHIEYGYAEIRISSQSCGMALESSELIGDVAPDFEPDDIEANDTVTITWEIES